MSHRDIKPGNDFLDHYGQTDPPPKGPATSVDRPAAEVVLTSRVDDDTFTFWRRWIATSTVRFERPEDDQPDEEPSTHRELIPGCVCAECRVLRAKR